MNSFPARSTLSSQWSKTNYFITAPSRRCCHPLDVAAAAIVAAIDVAAVDVAAVVVAVVVVIVLMVVLVYIVMYIFDTFRDYTSIQVIFS